VVFVAESAGGAFDVFDAGVRGFGFAWSCYNDGSIRDWQFHTNQWTPGKNFLNTGGFGPWLVTADEVGAVEELQLTTRVNRERDCPHFC